MINAQSQLPFVSFASFCSNPSSFPSVRICIQQCTGDKLGAYLTGPLGCKGARFSHWAGRNHDQRTIPITLRFLCFLLFKPLFVCFCRDLFQQRSTHQRNGSVRNKLRRRGDKFCREGVVRLYATDGWHASDDITIGANRLVCHDVEHHNTMQLSRIHPTCAHRLAVRLCFLLGGGSGLDVFATLLFIGIERLHRDIPTHWPCFLATRHLGKVLVRQLLRRGLLVRRGLTDHEDVLAQTIRTGPSGTTGDKQCDTRHPNE
jgi:hypothetical protein